MPGTAAGAKKAWRTRKAAKPIVMTRAQMIRMDEKAAIMAQSNRGGGFVSGIRLSLGNIEEDDNPAFRTLQTRISAFDRMLNDAKISAQERANILPIFSAVRVSVEGGDQEQRDLISQNLLREGDPRFWCETSWLQRILEKLMCLRYGFALHGKTWDTVDGYRVFRRLTYLHPRSLGGPLGAWEWNDDATRLVAIHRKYNKPDGSQEPDERIPIDLIFASVWWQTGENWEGQSLIRPMYRNWVNKDLASKIGMIALMNGGVGIPTAKMGPTDGPKDQTALTAIAGDLRGGSKERQFIVLKNGQEIELLTQGGTIVDARPIIDQNNMDISSGAGTDYLQQGQTASGSRAGGSVMYVAALQQLDATVRWLEEQINHGAGYLRGEVEDLLLANFPPSKKMARITLSRVSPTEQLDNVPNIGTAVQQGSITHDLSVENHVRKALGVPEIDQPTLDKLKTAPQPTDLGGRPNQPTPTDRNEPRNDSAGRAFGLAEKKTPDGRRPTRSSASYPWLRSNPA